MKAEFEENNLAQQQTLVSEELAERKRLVLANAVEGNSRVCGQDESDNWAGENEVLRERIQKANKDIAKLKHCIDEHLMANGITPRDNTNCAIARAIWLIEIMSTNVKQYQKDLETVKIQKKEVSAKKNKLEAVVEGLEFGKERLLAEMEVMVTRIRYLEGFYAPKEG